MDDATRLCLEADLYMALVPLAGQPWDDLARIDAKMRINAVVKKYRDDVLTCTPGGVNGDTYTLRVGVDPALVETLRAVLRTFGDELT